MRGLLPALPALLLIGLFPAACALAFSLLDRPDGFHALAADPFFREAIRRTLVLALIALPAEVILGLMLALLLRRPMPGRAVFVALLALPALVAPVVHGTAWLILLNNDYGPFNQALGWLIRRPVMTLWTEDPAFALPAVLIADIWQWTPFMFVLLYVALKSLDSRQFETAELADAAPWRSFFSIVFPAVWPALVAAILIRGLDLLRLFDVVWMLTRNVPGSETQTLSVFAYGRLLDAAGSSETAAMAFATLLAFALAWSLLLLWGARSR